MSETNKRVFVTVGSTAFDQLIEAVSHQAFLKLLQRLGYSHVTVQLGGGECVPGDEVEGVSVKWYRFKPSLTADMSAAALVISHGGAGCIMEALSLRKPLVVVINELLMDNHQTELARRLNSDGHLVYTTPNNLYGTVSTLDASTLGQFESGTPETFGSFIDKVFGFPAKS